MKEESDTSILCIFHGPLALLNPFALLTFLLPPNPYLTLAFALSFSSPPRP